MIDVVQSIAVAVLPDGVGVGRADEARDRRDGIRAEELREEERAEVAGGAGEEDRTGRSCGGDRFWRAGADDDVLGQDGVLPDAGDDLGVLLGAFDDRPRSAVAAAVAREGRVILLVGNLGPLSLIGKICQSISQTDRSKISGSEHSNNNTHLLDNLEGALLHAHIIPEQPSGAQARTEALVHQAHEPGGAKAVPPLLLESALRT